MSQPENQANWTDTIEGSGRTLELCSFVTRQRRMPKPVEMVQARMRGRPFSMVEESTVEWRLFDRGRLVATVYREPSGTCRVDSLRTRHSHPSDAVREWLSTSRHGTEPR